MSKAREIAEERLAKGEISQDEFDNLIAKLGDVPASGGGKPAGGAKKVGEYIFYIVGSFFLLSLYLGRGTSGLESNNHLQYDNMMKFDIENTTSKSGDVLVFLKSEAGNRKCPHLFWLEPKSNINRVTVPCSGLGKKPHTIAYGWASAQDKGLVGQAKRIHINWN